MADELSHYCIYERAERMNDVCPRCGANPIGHEQGGEVCRLTAERDQYKQLFDEALDAADRVFQVDHTKPPPLLPDFLRLGESKTKGVVKLAEAYIELTAERDEAVAERDRLAQRLEKANSPLDDEDSGIEVYQPAELDYWCWRIGGVDVGPFDTRREAYAYALVYREQQRCDALLARLIGNPHRDTAG